jgi:hypothetical protein
MKRLIKDSMEVCPDAEYLEWLRQRMIHAHGENPHADHMVKFKEIIKARFYVGGGV